MAELNFSFDASGWLRAYNRGIEDAFIMIADFSELESLLQINKIEYGEEK